MAAVKIGTVKSGRGKSYEVKWSGISDGDVYVSYGGWTYAGKASSARHAMQVAEAWLQDK